MFPYKGGKKKVELKAINFDWDSPDPRISFRDSKVLAFDGSIGYGIGGGRVELEVGYEKFKTKGVKRGEGEEEGIYLLAKDLAYNVALDQTDKLTEGIKLLTKKNMHDVSNAINILDPSQGTNNGICKTFENGGSESHAGTQCSTSESSKKGLSDFFSAGNNQWKDKEHEKWSDRNAKVAAKDISTNLNREQKGVVSSAFAKAHEGAEIVEIRSISTTSVMVNACYDVLTEGLPVSPYACAGIMRKPEC